MRADRRRAARVKRRAVALQGARTPVRFQKRRQKGSLVLRAYCELKALILRNEIRAGSHALETELAARLSMSRTPVREALLRLQADGLVQIKPRRGVRILPISPTDMREIYELLCCLEATAAELVAARRLSFDSPEIVSLQSAIVRMQKALRRNDLDDWAAADETFHRLLVEYSGNQRLQRFAMTVWDQAHRARILTLRYRRKPTDSGREHRATLDAIRRGDERAAYERHRAHRLRGMKLILSILDRHQLWAL